jgi:nicotinamidase/pyrazinamidase
VNPRARAEPDAGEATLGVMIFAAVRALAGAIMTLSHGAPPMLDSDVLLVVDVQNDFCDGGALAVPHAEEIIPLVNRLATQFDNVVLTQDWHPREHQSFASVHPGRKPHEVIPASYGQQVLWPNHCVQGTEGAQLHRQLDIPHAQLIIRKGFRRAIDSYSAFYENDHRTRTGLSGYLRDRGLSHVFLVGLAFDFCVRYSAEDAQRDGFRATVIEDACRGIDVDGSVASARRALADHGVEFAGAGTVEAERRRIRTSL